MKQRIILLMVITLIGWSIFLVLMWGSVIPTGAHANEAPQGNVQETPTVDPTVVALQKEQLFLKVNELQTNNTWYWVIWTKLSPSLTVFLGIGAGLWTLFRWRRDRRDEQKRREDDQQLEQVKRAEERFQIAVAALGNQEVGMRIGAAITLRTFLGEEYKQFHHQIFDLAVANLRLRKADPDTPAPLEPLDQALITLFKESFPLVRDELKDELRKAKMPFEPQSLGAASIELDNAYLVGVDLKKGWLTQAFLRQADLRGAHLEDAHLEDAHMDDASLIDAHLEGAYLKGVALIKAKLEGANFTKANLEGAWLTRANLVGAVLQWAHFDKANFTNADLRGVHLEGAWLIKANLMDANLEGARLIGAHLDEANLEDAKSLKNANLSNATGLTSLQIVACKQKGAIIDDVALQPTLDTNRPNRQTST